MTGVSLAESRAESMDCFEVFESNKISAENRVTQLNGENII
jgi:hypothetical protein